MHPERPEHFTREQFIYTADADCYVCPRGKTLSRYSKGRVRQSFGIVYRADACDCALWSDAGKCLLKKAGRRTLFRVTETLPAAPRPRTACERMADLIDTEKGRAAYAHRMGIVEPVFANISATKGMRRFTLRGLTKVRVQWLLFCLVHNIEKLLTSGAFERLQTAGC